MRNLDDITHPDELREIARAQQGSLSQMQVQMEILQRQVAKLQNGTPQLAAEVARVLAEIQRAKATPGHSSESRRNKPVKVPKPQKGHGPTGQPALPMEEVVHKLDDADKPCPECGKELKEWAGKTEDCEVIDVKVREHVRQVHKRQKYQCSCGHIETALGEPRLVESGRYSDAFIIQRAVEKYVDHIPLERQVRILAREGLTVTSQALWDQLVALHHKVLLPAKKRLIAYQATKPVRHGDETRWPVFEKRVKNWTMWVDGSDDALVYEILETRGADAGAQLFSSVNGVLVVDGYSVYPALQKTHPNITLAFCWAHARRKFIELESGHPPVATLLKHIGELFHIDKDGPDDGRLARRQTRSTNTVKDIQAWLLATPALPESPLRKAMNYMANHWTGLTRFLSDAAIPLENNLAERGLRGPVVGRKNHYGSHSLLGTQVAAAIYSLMETAKLNGIAPDAYVAKAVQAFHRGEEIPLPHELKPKS